VNEGDWLRVSACVPVGGGPGLWVRSDGSFECLQIKAKCIYQILREIHSTLCLTKTLTLFYKNPQFNVPKTLTLFYKNPQFNVPKTLTLFYKNPQFNVPKTLTLLYKNPQFNVRLSRIWFNMFIKIWFSKYSRLGLYIFFFCTRD
jgi:hypothetical protein